MCVIVCLCINFICSVQSVTDLHSPSAGTKHGADRVLRVAEPHGHGLVDMNVDANAAGVESLSLWEGCWRAITQATISSLWTSPVRRFPWVSSHLACPVQRCPKSPLDFSRLATAVHWSTHGAVGRAVARSPTSPRPGKKSAGLFGRRTSSRCEKMKVSTMRPVADMRSHRQRSAQLPQRNAQLPQRTNQRCTSRASRSTAYARRSRPPPPQIPPCNHHVQPTGVH